MEDVQDSNQYEQNQGSIRKHILEWNTLFHSLICKYSLPSIIGIGSALAGFLAAFFALHFLNFVSECSPNCSNTNGSSSVYLIFESAAAIAALVSGTFLWWLLMIKPQQPVRFLRGILVGALCSVVAHPLTWLFILIFATSVDANSMSGYFPAGSHLDTGTIFYFFFFFVFGGLLSIGWFTALVGGIGGYLFALIQQALYKNIDAHALSTVSPGIQQNEMNTMQQSTALRTSWTLQTLLPVGAVFLLLLGLGGYSVITLSHQSSIYAPDTVNNPQPAVPSCACPTPTLVPWQKAGDFAIIHIAAQPSTPGFDLTINGTGGGSIVSVLSSDPAANQRYPQMYNPPSGTFNVNKLSQDLAKVGDVSNVPIGTCTSSNASLPSETITYNGITSGNLNCYSANNALDTDLIQQINMVVTQAYAARS